MAQLRSCMHAVRGTPILPVFSSAMDLMLVCKTMKKTAALHYACFHQMKACVEQLLANGGDPNAKDIQGLTPLIVACFKRHGSIGSCHFGNPIVSWC